MKQSGKKALSYFLTLLMILSCLTALTPSLAAYALDEEERVSALLSVETTQFTTAAEAGAYLREHMKARETTIEFNYSMPAEKTQEEGFFKALMNEIHAEAFAHTGEADEGDFLKSTFSDDFSAVRYSISGGTADLTIKMSVVYKTTAAQEAELSSKVSEVLGNIITEGMSDSDKVRAINDYICNNVEYDYTNLNNSSYDLKYTAYAAMINGTSVCEGYATLFYYMCLKSGVDCRILSGKANNGESNGPHAWNLVKLDSKYSLIDTTWNDGTHSDKYFIKGVDVFAEDHFADDESKAIMAQYDIECSHAVKNTVNAKEATCSEAGYTGDVICEVCGMIITKGEAIEKIKKSTTVFKFNVNTIEKSYGDISFRIPYTIEGEDEIEWQSTDEAIAKVNASGQIYILSAIPENYNKKVKIIGVSNGISDSCELIIKNPISVIEAPARMSLFIGTPKGIDIDLIGADASCPVTETPDFEYSSDDISIATVNSSGIITPVAKGKCKITVSVKGRPELMPVTIDITVSQAQKVTKLVPVGGMPTQITVNATAEAKLYVYPTTATNKEVRWTSSDESVATVTPITTDELSYATAAIRGVRSGTALITYEATDDSGVKGSFSITVNPLVQMIMFDKRTIVAYIGSSETVKINATCQPVNAGNQKLNWVSSNEEIATVVDGKIKLNMTGTCDITAIAQDGSGVSKTATLLVLGSAETMSMSSAPKTMDVGDKFDLDCTVVTRQGVTYQVEDWSVDNEKLASVDENGLVTALCPGKIKVTARYFDGTSVSKTIEILGEHKNLVSVDGVLPTCTENGHTEYKKCLTCGEYVSGNEVIPALGHDYSETVVVEPPTCIKDGKINLFCSRCGIAKSDKEWIVIPNSGSTIYPETPHSYSNSKTYTYSFSYPGAEKLELTFSSSTKTESNYDYIYIYDSTGSLYGKYCGTQLSSKTITLSGDSFKIKLTTDGSVTDYGFSFSKIRAYAGSYDSTLISLGHTDNDSDNFCDRCGEYCASSLYRSGFCGDNVTYKLYNDGMLVISGTGDMYSYRNSSSPFYSHRSRIKKVTITDGVTKIGNYAFNNCYNIVSVKIADSVESIGEYAFRYCSSLKSVNINDLSAWCDIDFENIYSNPMYYTRDLCCNGELIKELNIPDSVTEIKDFAFYRGSFETATIGNSVETIGRYAFAECRTMTDVVIPDSVSSIGEGAFYRAGMKKAVIGNSVKTIGIYAFAQCRTMTDVVIPDSVNSIGDYAFYRAGMKKAVIGNSVETIGNYAFAQCRTMTDVVIPDSVTSIGESAFEYCYELKDVVIPDSVTKIGSWSFYRVGIESAVVGKSVEKIDSTVFAECRTMTDITILNPDCNITEHETTFPTKATIHGYHNSTAYRYSYLYNRHFDFLDDHTLKAEFTLPESCISHGFSVMKCEFCDYKTNELIAPSGHIDHDNDGVCDICALGLTGGCRHDFTSAYIAPTCTEPGYMSLTCSLCGESYRNETDSALGHTYDSGVVTPPTATENGYITYTCVVCGDSYIENTLLPENAPVISVSTEKCLDGKTVEVTISVKNNPGVVNMQLTVSYDTPLKLVKVTDGEILGEEMHVPNLNRNPYYLTWANDLATENFTEDGVIATLTFEVPEGTEEGDYGISVTYSGIDYDIVNKDFETVDFYIINGSVNVVNYIVCDANGDGIVNTADRMLIARYTAKWDGYDEQISDIRALDVNGDGRVNTADRMILSRALAKWTGYDVYLK